MRWLGIACVLAALLLGWDAPLAHARTCEKWVKVAVGTDAYSNPIMRAKRVEVECPAEEKPSGSGLRSSDSGGTAPARPLRPSIFIPECWDSMSAFRCRPPDPWGTPAAPRPATRDDAQAIVEEAVQTLAIPKPVIHIGPDPSVNEWRAAVVGFPLWLWSDPAPTVSESTTFAGRPMTLTARLQRITYVMGDGGSVTCTATTPYPPGTVPGTPSPTCGYAYKKASRPTGDYTVTATASWAVEWQALGFSGTLPMQTTASRQVPVTELQAVVTR